MGFGTGLRVGEEAESWSPDCILLPIGCIPPLSLMLGFIFGIWKPLTLLLMLRKKKRSPADFHLSCRPQGLAVVPAAFQLCSVDLRSLESSWVKRVLAENSVTRPLSVLCSLNRKGLCRCPAEPSEELTWLHSERLCVHVCVRVCSRVCVCECACTPVHTCACACGFMCVALLMSLQRGALVCLVMVPVSEPHA